MRKIGTDKFIDYSIFIILVMTIVLTTINVLTSDGDKGYLVMLYVSTMLLFWLTISGNRKLKKMFQIKRIQSEGKKMDKEILLRLLDQKVLIHTMDSYIDGKIVEVTDTVVVVKKYNKKDEEKKTYYVNNSMIMSIENI